VALSIVFFFFSGCQKKSAEDLGDLAADRISLPLCCLLKVLGLILSKWHAGVALSVFSTRRYVRNATNPTNADDATTASVLAFWPFRHLRSLRSVRI